MVNKDLNPCPECEPKWRVANDRWSKDVIDRIEEWDALMRIAVRLTGKSQKELVDLVIKEKGDQTNRR